jgi:hypothetical protein
MVVWCATLDTKTAVLVPVISPPLGCNCQNVASWLLFCAHFSSSQAPENFVRAKSIPHLRSYLY